MALLKELDENITVVTSTYVVNEAMPILYVSNDNDDEGGSIWQFHCGNGDYDMKKMLLVKLGTVLKIDSGLVNLELGIGEEAKRESTSSNWIKTKQVL
ncbi:hypothetical protein [Flagellimonas sp.]|uniref:hypothetical protein n=1 Tax=Flagellimonas sp. TaxID=2058762 RepID=UPI003B50FA83